MSLARSVGFRARRGWERIAGAQQGWDVQESHLAGDTAPGVPLLLRLGLSSLSQARTFPQEPKSMGSQRDLGAWL